MKAFLMFRDRDFDPDLLLTRRDRELRQRRGADDPNLDLQQRLPWNAQALTQDLGLDAVLAAMAQGDAFLLDVAKVALLSSLSDPDAIFYRQHALADSLRNADIIAEMYRISVEAIESERKGYWGFFARYPSGILQRAVESMQMFVGHLRRLRNLADRHAAKFESAAFIKLFAMFEDELSDEYFATISEHLQRLKFRHGILVSAQLGRGNKGDNYVLRRPQDDARGWLARLLAEKPPSYTFHLHPRDEAGARALSELTDRGVNLAANALGQSADHILSFFQMLRTELAFYLGCINLHARLGALAEPVCFPVTMPAAGEISFAGLYDPSLALSKGEKVVGNDFHADRLSLLIITGANTGGKSTFLRSAGLAQLMMQAGMFVAAEGFSAGLCSGLCTHYKREEDATMERGKWEEELGRMSEIVDRLGVNSLLLCNESFASTNDREGSQIAEQITAALVERGVRVFFVTHLSEFARRFYARRLDGTRFLRAERHADGTRTYRLSDGAPLQTSYGEDLYDAVFGADRSNPQESVNDVNRRQHRRSTLIRG
jgi:MutS domain V